MRSGIILGALTVLVRWTYPTSASASHQLPLDIPVNSPSLALGAEEHDEISILSENIVSALSASSQHTTFLHLLQRSKSIPLLAHIGNATVFAPTDDAWLRWADNDRVGPSLWLGSGGLDEWLLMEEEAIQRRLSVEGVKSDDVIRTMDNQNWHLRQHLLYHMLNYTLSPYDLLANYTTGSSTNVTTQTTLLFPLNEEPELPPTPPPGAPWLPRGGEGMLGGHGQRLRIAKAGSVAGGKRGKVAVDWNGENGVNIWDGKGWKGYNGTGLGHAGLKGGRWTRNGLVIGVEDVLDMPLSIDEVIESHPSLSHLAHLLKISEPLSNPLPDNLKTTPHLTIFAPSNNAFEDAFDEIENAYLEGPYGAEGVGRIVANGVVLGTGKKLDEVGWHDSLRKEYQESASGQNLFIETPKNGSLLVNNTEATAVDIFASNGVIHIMPNLLLPENFTLLNSAEKVLLSVNATRFVSLLRTANLSSTYVGPPSKEKEDEQAWTILAPTDDVLDMMDRWGGPGVPGIPSLLRDEIGAEQALASGLIDDIPFKDSSPLANLLKYHFLPGRLLPEDIKDEMLVETELRTSALKGGRQRLRVEVSDKLDPEDWDAISIGEIRFGGATVLAKPVKSGKSIIYLISSLLSLPDDVLQTAVSDLQLSTFIAAVYAAGLDKAVKKTPGITYIVPRNKAFNNLGLGMKYLLLPEGKDDLRKVIKYHAIEGVVYSSDVTAGWTTYKTLEGGEVVLERLGKGDNTTISVSSPNHWPNHDSGERLPANGELRPARITDQDALTDNGVIHTIDNVVMPADVALTNGKLVRGSRQSVMAELMYRVGLSWVLEGREPTSQEVSRAELTGDVQALDEDGETSPGGDIDSLALPGYVFLCPTDKALSRINLTSYIQNPPALLDLLKLHIISTQPSTLPKGSYRHATAPPEDGRPLTMGDDLIYSTLLSGKSKFGDVAFRATGDNTYLVGIRGAKGRGGAVGEFARIGQSGRASVRWRKREALREDDGEVTKPDGGDHGGGMRLWRGGMSLGGGVMMIDSVLVPYEPSWFSRWGWLVIGLVGLGVILIGAACGVGYWWIKKEKKEEYEPLEGEEEE